MRKYSQETEEVAQKTRANFPEENYREAQGISSYYCDTSSQTALMQFIERI